MAKGPSLKSSVVNKSVSFRVCLLVILLGHFVVFTAYRYVMNIEGLQKS